MKSLSKTVIAVLYISSVLLTVCSCKPSVSSNNSAQTSTKAAEVDELIDSEMSNFLDSLEEWDENSSLEDQTVENNSKTNNVDNTSSSSANLLDAHNDNSDSSLNQSQTEANNSSQQASSAVNTYEDVNSWTSGWH